MHSTIGGKGNGHMKKRERSCTAGSSNINISRTRKRAKRNRRIGQISLDRLVKFLIGVCFSILFFVACENQWRKNVPLASTVSVENKAQEKVQKKNRENGKNRENEKSREDWKLVLVNASHPLEKEYPVEVVDLKNGQLIDVRCYEELQRMMDDCRESGLQPLICSSYRTRRKQEILYEQKIDELLSKGYSKEAAQKEAATVVAYPGTSEHEIGLAVDIVDNTYQMLETDQEDTPVQRWLIANCWKYGFILRYPKNKKEKTGVIYEPWHYRYVGVEAAKTIMQENICLEEYLCKDIR